MSEVMNSLMDFASMGGYALYVWGSLGMCALVMGAEVAWLRTRRAALLRQAGSALEQGPP
jgi:heme exporter protein D